MNSLQLKSQEFVLNTFSNAPTSGRKTKDGEIHILYNQQYSVPQLVRKRYYKSVKYIRELTSLKLCKEFLTDKGICYNIPSIIEAPDDPQHENYIYTTWCGYGMNFWKKYYNQRVEDFASLILQYTYTIATVNDFLNIKNIDMHRGNILFKPKPCKGNYKLTYILRKDNETVFHVELKTSYIFTLIDWATIDISDYNRPIHSSIAKILSRDKRSTSNSTSRSEYVSNFNLYSNFLSFWMGSMEYYFPSKSLLDKGLDIRKLSFLINGAEEWSNIVQKLAEMINNKDILNVIIADNLCKASKISFPSFNYFDVKMYIEWVPHIVNNNNLLLDVSNNVLENKKKRGRPKKYDSNAEKQRMYRIKKNRKKYESTYDVAYNELEIFGDAYDVVDKILQEEFTVQCVIDTKLLILKINAINNIGVFANGTIQKDDIITKYEGAVVTTRNFDNLYMLKLSRNLYIDGIRYPMHLCGVGSLIRRSSSRRDCNIEFIKVDDEMWAKAKKLISKNEELIAPL